MLKQTILTLGLISSLLSPILAQNLIKNGDCELPTTNGKIPNWIEVVGSEWQPNNTDAVPQSGQFYFYAGGARNAELMQEIDVTEFACPIDASKQKFDFKGFVRSFAQNPIDQSRIIIEYRNATNTILATYDSGLQTTTSAWLALTDSRSAPASTRKIRIRLLSTMRSGTDNDGYYDNMTLIPNPALLKIDTIRKATATCNLANGTARISISGGIQPIQFKIDNLTTDRDSMIRNLSSGNHTVVVTDGANCAATVSFNIPNLPPPTLVSVQTTPSVCGRNNGSVKVITQNGTGFLTYQLTNRAARSQARFDSLAGGSYLLTIRDSIGCTDTTTVIVVEKTKPVVDSVRVLPASCNKNNGQINVFGRGETPNIQYSLDSIRYVSSPIFSNLRDSNYRVFVIDSNKCITSKTIVVARLAPPIFDTVTIKPSTCGKDNGNISIAARNVKCSLDSLMFTTVMQFPNLRGGNYTIYIRDSANCTIGQKTVVPKIPSPTINDIKVFPESCKKNDGQIVVKASSPYSSLTYSINANYSNRDSFLNLSSGIFVVNVKDTFGCVINQNITIQNQSVPIIEDIKTTPSVCEGGTGIIFIKAKSSIDLSYSIDGNQFQTDNLFRSVKVGKYNIVVKDKNDCRTTVQAEVGRDCGLFIPTAFSPNEDSFNDYFTFFGDASKFDKVLDFKVFNRWGILIFSDNTVQINNETSGWDGKFKGREVETGMYLFYLKIQLKDGTTLTEKGDITLIR
jgi:gliding motility-associated-like protein